MDKLLSVIVTTYNREKTIKRTIDSILAQTYKNFEIIVVDDCSKDNTVDIIKSYSDSRIKLYENKVNLGVEKNKNEAFKYVNGEAFVYIDSDDYYTDIDFFNDAMNELENQDVNMYIAIANFEDGTGYKNNLGFEGILDVEDYLNGYQSKYERAPQGSMVIKTKVFVETGIVDLNGIDDVTMALGGIGLSGFVYGSNKNVMIIEQQSNSVTKKIAHSLITCHIKGTKKLYDYYNNHNLIHERDSWIVFQIRALISYYMSSPGASFAHIRHIIGLLFENNIPKKILLIKSMILDYLYIKRKNKK